MNLKMCRLVVTRVVAGSFEEVGRAGLWQHRPCLGRNILAISLFLIGVVIKSNSVWANNESLRFSENANLAIRRTAHILLSSNGDSTTTIPPVHQTGASTFTIELTHVFKYEELPKLLQKSLDQYGIKRGYHVAILDCDTGAVQLGYNFLDLQQPEGVPCLTRTEKEGCHILKVVFDPEKPVASTVVDLKDPDNVSRSTKKEEEGSDTLKVVFNPEKQVVSKASGWWFLPFGSVVLLAGFMFWRRSRKDHIEGQLATIPLTEQRPKIVFGNSQLDPSNLTLICSNAVHNLTYREAKLLKLFVLHANQILEREIILKSVWEDEGVTVGRSVDVFVSRLRKMLSADPAIKIAAVHGIGYRMEVAL